MAEASTAFGASREARGMGLPLTEVQRDVWINCQLSRGGSAAYNLSTTMDLKGDLDVEALRASVQRLVQRHDSLRSTFDPTGDRRIIHATVEADLRVIDVSDRDTPGRAMRVAEFVDSELSTPYDLVEGPLFRATLIRLGDADHILVISAHHLVCDGWSLGVMERDLGAFYSALVAGEQDGLGEPTRFSEYAGWRMDESTLSEPYWLELYDDQPVDLDLPTDKARPPVRTYEYGSDRAVIDGELLTALKELAAAQRVTLFIVLLAAWEVMLHRLSGQGEFANGVFVSGQASMGVPGLVGLCANILPLGVRVTPDEPLSDYLERLKFSTLDALDNQDYSVGQLASALRLPRDASRPSVVSTAITLETPTEGIAFKGLRAVPTNFGRRTYGSYDFEAYLNETGEDLTVDFQYATDVFESDTMQRWLGYYTRLLRQMTTRVSAPVSELRLLDEAERLEILTKWNNTSSPVPKQSIRERFEQQAAEHPDRPAIRTSDRSIAYGELNAMANRLARHLRQVGVEPERLVGIHLDRSADVVVALLAVHKAGGAYVPLDPIFPTERLSMIAQDAGLQVLITHEKLADVLSADGAVVVALDRDASAIAELGDSDLGIVSAPSDLAYVISTSGSTGTPKGVEITQYSLTNQLTSMLDQPGLQPDDVLLSVTTMSFDPALLEIFLPIITGATIVLADAREAGDAVWLRKRLAMGDITVMQATPATWQMLLDAGWEGTPGLKALCGGEALTEELALAVSTRVESLWNVYGTTETTIWSSSSKVSRDGGLIPIGPPISNTEYHVLDQQREPQPPGVIGELHIGGIGLARGYRSQPGLTHDRFILHSFDDEPPRRLYRTGDLARRLADGRIEFLGRDDFQVKIRGYRIELGEIETVLARYHGVQDCVVVARVGADGTKRLVAYIVPTADGHDNISALRMYLRTFLPDYMVPSVFVPLEAMPLSPNKKVDRSRLPDPDSHRPDLATELVEPRNQNEATLARIWGRFLNVDEVGVEDNFFDLGGDSLSALRAMIEANSAGISLAVSSIFQYQTIAELALAAAGDPSADDQGVVTGSMPLTPAQLRFLYERETPDAHHWNLSHLVQASRLSPRALRTATMEILRHHDALRLRLWQEEGRWQQELVSPSDEIPFESHDISRLSAEERIAEIERICTALQQSFRLDEGVLLRVAHFDCGPDENDRLFVTAHHFAVDGLTWAVFWEDLEKAYRQAADGAVVSLPPKTTSVREWAVQLEHLVQTPRIVQATHEWLGEAWDDVVKIPTDFPADPGSNTNDSTAVVGIELSSDDTRRLLSGAQRPEHVIITALAHSLSSWTSSQTVLLDVLSHGRDATLEGVNLSRTVGFTLAYNPLVLSHPTWDGTRETLDVVAAQIDAGPEGFSFELLRFLAPDQDLRERLDALPRAEMLFNYAGVDAEGDDNVVWKPAHEPTGPSDSPRGRRQYPIAVRATLNPDLQLAFVYSTKLHAATTIEARVAEVAATIDGLLGET